jgi:hypothetical protein
MRNLFLGIFAVLSTAACGAPDPTSASTENLTSSAAAPRTSACVVIADNGDNLPFAKATAQTDHEYETLEVGVLHGIQFLLKAGHGVARLEAAVNGKLVAATFYQTGVDTDSLRLDALGPSGKLVEAQCDHIDTKL